MSRQGFSKFYGLCCRQCNGGMGLNSVEPELVDKVLLPGADSTSESARSNLKICMAAVSDATAATKQAKVFEQQLQHALKPPEVSTARNAEAAPLQADPRTLERSKAAELKKAAEAKARTREFEDKCYDVLAQQRPDQPTEPEELHALNQQLHQDNEELKQQLQEQLQGPELVQRHLHSLTTPSLTFIPAWFQAHLHEVQQLKLQLQQAQQLQPQLQQAQREAEHLRRDNQLLQRQIDKLAAEAAGEE